MDELASGPAITAYYDRVVRTRLLPSGRVDHHPLSEYETCADGGHRFRNLLPGATTEVRVRRKVVDSTYSSPSVPSTHRPRFTVVWLVQHGADPDTITWVVPRDSWLINRVTTQPGPEFFTEAIGGQADQLEALVTATGTEDLFLRLERAGILTRIDRDRLPGMFHLATVAPGEVEVLRRIRDVVRLGRVRELHDDRIVLQLVRLPQPAFSAALTAWVEARHDDDETKTRLCGTVPYPHTLDDDPATMLATMWNQYHWGQDAELRRWIRASRLDGFGKLMAEADREDPVQQDVLTRIKQHAPGAVANLTRLVEARV